MDTPELFFHATGLAPLIHLMTLLSPRTAFAFGMSATGSHRAVVVVATARVRCINPSTPRLAPQPL